MADSFNDINTMLGTMLDCDEKKILEGFKSLQDKGLISVKVVGINENGEEMLEIKLSESVMMNVSVEDTLH